MGISNQSVNFVKIPPDQKAQSLMTVGACSYPYFALVTKHLEHGDLRQAAVGDHDLDRVISPGKSHFVF